MKARTARSGLFVLLLPIILPGAEELKLPFTCTADDLQWAGMECSEAKPCPIFLELSSVRAAGSKLFLSGAIHSEQTTLYSILLRSDDSGVTWKEPVGRTRGEVLDDIQFETYQTGWVSGQRVMPLTGDPFLLLTQDGGMNWRRSPILPEGSPGLIQKYRFDSEKNGRVLIDQGRGADSRYRLFESKDGGETWTQREASATPIANAPVQEEEQLWRLQADAGGKKFLLEHRKGEQWAAVASFTLQLAECRGE